MRNHALADGWCNARNWEDWEVDEYIRDFANDTEEERILEQPDVFITGVLYPAVTVIPSSPVLSGRAWRKRNSVPVRKQPWREAKAKK